MRVMLVSFVFPPHNVIGAVRVGKLAKYLTRFGHDVRVLTALDPPFPKDLALEIPADLVTHTPWARVDRPLRAAVSLASRIRSRSGREPRATNGHGYESSNGNGNGHGAESNGVHAPATSRSSALGWLAERYQDFVYIPDDNIGWLPSATAAGLRMAREFRPQVIFASGKPWTSLVVAHRVATRSGVPWIAEFRDPWGSNPYDASSRFRQHVDDWLSRRIVRSASGVVTVSPPLAAVYAEKYQKPSSVVMSGYDDEDQPAAAPSNGLADDGRLWIVHAGTFYAQRDLTPLVRAIHTLGDRARRVRVSLVGAEPAGVQSALNLAAALGVADSFELSTMVSRGESLRIQRAADVLLLAMWNDPREYTFLPGKLFEYVGARRPILLVGLVTGAAAELVKTRLLGVALDSADDIALWLGARLAEKARLGRTAAPPASAREGLAFEAQARRLEGFLERFAIPARGPVQPSVA